MAGAAVVQRSRGRPRDAQLDAAIAAATIALLQERGYNGLSIKAVAERAGTTTPAVYRRWPSKADLVLHVVLRIDGDDVIADTGDLAADVRTMVRWSLEKLGSRVGRAALAGLLAEPPEQQADLQAQLAGIWRAMGDRLRRAANAGDVRPDLDVDALIAAIAGPAMVTAIARGPARVKRATVDALASIALEGISA
jgi:AcrR family transcriptional regulator